MGKGKKIVGHINDFLTAEINVLNERISKLKKDRKAVLLKTDAQLKYKVWLRSLIQGEYCITLINKGSLESTIKLAIKKFKKDNKGSAAMYLWRVHVYLPNDFTDIELPKELIKKYQAQVSRISKKYMQTHKKK